MSKSLAARGIEIPFHDDLGLDYGPVEGGRAECYLDVGRRHTNSWGVVHGGVVMTMLDVAMAMAGRSVQASQQGGNVTVEMKTTFVRGAKGPRLTARGTCFHTSTSMAFCEGELIDSEGQVCAKASGTFKFLKSWEAAAKLGMAPTTILKGD
ncbi:hypothetical protein IP84_02195 [beta proteobacterium AAP99]|jgi:uncharacterized protein (TIGR00369 family)|nr:hypothetical protein IP84_02195 [beta proteobacterium AAP99]